MNKTQTLSRLTRTAERLERAREERDELIREATEQKATRRQVAKSARLSVGRIQQIVGVLAMALMGLALGAGSAQATTISATGKDQALLQVWADASLAPTPPITLFVIPDAGAGPPFVLKHGDLTLHWYDNEHWSDQPLTRALFLHELGHVFDRTMMRPKLRRAFVRIIKPRHSRRTIHWWWSFASWGEKFAMAYSYCALGIADPPTPYYWGFSYNPTASQQARVCALIQRA